MNEDNEFTRLGVAGALARNYAQDSRGFMPLLAMVLQAAIPAETKVERKGGFFQKDKPVQKITVTIGEDIYTLEDPGRGGLQAHRQQFVRGIRLKTEPMPVETWLSVLCDEISKRAAANENAFFALKDLLRL